MNVVDSSAWLSYFAGEENASVFAAPIENLRKLLVPSITLTEVFRHVCRHRDEESALTVIAHMTQGEVIDLDAELAINAASLGLAHKLPLADSIILATARKYGATLWTQDRDFEGMAGVKYHSRADR